MLYLVVNIGAWLIILGLFGLSVFLDWKSFKHPQIVDMVLVAMLIAVAVILTNVISYNFLIFGATIRLSLGAFLIFVTGALLGPFWGVISGVTADTLGLLVGINGVYNAIFTLDKTLYGFMGALAFWGWTNKWWLLKFICFYVLTFIIVSFGLDVLYIYVQFGRGGIVSALITKLIKFWLEIIVYCFLAIIAFLLLYQLLEQRRTSPFWAQRQGRINFRLKKIGFKKHRQSVSKI